MRSGDVTLSPDRGGCVVGPVVNDLAPAGGFSVTIAAVALPSETGPTYGEALSEGHHSQTECLSQPGCDERAHWWEKKQQSEGKGRDPR